MNIARQWGTKDMPQHLLQSEAEALAAVEKKRGYLLTYHRMLAHSDPALLSAYDGFYERLTLLPRHLTMRERELVWAGLLVAAREAHGALHMRRAIESGLTAAEIADAVALAAAAESFAGLEFASHHWAQWVPPALTEARYLSVTVQARGTVPAAIAELILLVCHAARRNQQGLRLHLLRAFAAGADIGQVAEGLSYLLLPCGGPTLIDAVATWSEVAADRLCPAPYNP